MSPHISYVPKEDRSSGAHADGKAVVYLRPDQALSLADSIYAQVSARAEAAS